MSAHTLWWISLAIGLVAALIAAGLLATLVLTVERIDASVKSLLAGAVRVGGDTQHITELAATAPVVGQIVAELHVQDDYMNALTDGFGAEL